MMLFLSSGKSRFWDPSSTARPAVSPTTQRTVQLPPRWRGCCVSLPLKIQCMSVSTHADRPLLP